MRMKYEKRYPCLIPEFKKAQMNEGMNPVGWVIFFFLVFLHIGGTEPVAKYGMRSIRPIRTPVLLLAPLYFTADTLYVAALKHG